MQVFILIVRSLSCGRNVLVEFTPLNNKKSCDSALTLCSSLFFTCRTPLLDYRFLAPGAGAVYSRDLEMSGSFPMIPSSPLLPRVQRTKAPLAPFFLLDLSQVLPPFLLLPWYLGWNPGPGACQARQVLYPDRAQVLTSYPQEL